MHPLLKAAADESFVGTAFIPNNMAFERFGREVGISAEDIIAGNSSFKDQVSSLPQCAVTGRHSTHLIFSVIIL